MINVYYYKVRVSKEGSVQLLGRVCFLNRTVKVKSIKSITNEDERCDVTDLLGVNVFRVTRERNSSSFKTLLAEGDTTSFSTLIAHYYLNVFPAGVLRNTSIYDYARYACCVYGFLEKLIGFSLILVCNKSFR